MRNYSNAHYYLWNKKTRYKASLHIFISKYLYVAAHNYKLKKVHLFMERAAMSLTTADLW